MFLKFQCSRLDVQRGHFFLFVVDDKMRRRVFINFTREIVIITRSIVFIFSELIVFLFLDMGI